ncbi:hypothetical protein ABT093_24265 [Kitasatospora sp. NPDC002551]|uniref:hypothetical protein n=1 Tax=Kitasatospora sp. NPDC002551 TaxID=3154539 RepID=UPI0033316606
MNTTITVTADPASPEEMGAAAVTAITETLKTAAVKRPPVDRQAPWRIEGTPYSAARFTVGDLAAVLAGLPDHLPVMAGTPAWNARDIAPVRSTVWNGALTVKTTPAAPDPHTRPLDLGMPTPSPADDDTAMPAAASRRGLLGVLTIGDLAAVLDGLPDHAPVMVLVPGWCGDAELVLDYVTDDGDWLVLDADYPTCDPFGLTDRP